MTQNQLQPSQMRTKPLPPVFEESDPDKDDAYSHVAGYSHKLSSTRSASALKFTCSRI